MQYFIDFLALALLYALVFFRKWRARGAEALLLRTLFYLYLAAVLFVTLMPVLTALPTAFAHSYRFMNLTPFIDVIMGRGDYIRQIVLNILMTVPFGFLFPLIKTPAAGFLKTVGFCFLMSLGIELLQPFIDGFRSGDVTDLITNTLGGAVGYGLLCLFRAIFPKILPREQGGN